VAPEPPVVRRQVVGRDGRSSCGPVSTGSRSARRQRRSRRPLRPTRPRLTMVARGAAARIAAAAGAPHGRRTRSSGLHRSTPRGRRSAGRRARRGRRSRRRRGRWPVGARHDCGRRPRLALRRAVWLPGRPRSRPSRSRRAPAPFAPAERAPPRERQPTGEAGDAQLGGGGDIRALGYVERVRVTDRCALGDRTMRRPPERTAEDPDDAAGCPTHSLAAGDVGQLGMPGGQDGG
jgi:hypothetical protein